MELVGADLGGTNFRAGLVSGGELVKTASHGIDGASSRDKLLEELYSLIDRVITPSAAGIGVGVPTIVDLKRGLIRSTTNIPSWKDVPLRDLLEARYRVPVRLNNDANCFAAGEKLFGKAKDFDSAVGVVLGTGLGAGLILDGKLYSGPNCGAGEFGEIPYLGHNLEYYCSGKFFRNVHNTTGRDAFAGASAGDRKALGMFAEFGGHLGEAVKIILYAVDPEIIVFGGSVSSAFRFFAPALRESLRSFSYPETAEKLKLAASETENIAILGAAALCRL